MNSSDFNRIEELLLCIGTDPYKNLVYVHGILMALKSGPNKINLKRWLLSILISEVNDQVYAETMELLFLLKTLSHQIAYSFQMMEAELLVVEPVIFEKGKSIHLLSASLKQIACWCDGYIDGAILHDSIWTRSKKGRAVLLPISVIAGHLKVTASLLQGNIKLPADFNQMDFSIFYRINHVQDIPKYIVENYKFCQSLKEDQEGRGGYLH